MNVTQIVGVLGICLLCSNTKLLAQKKDSLATQTAKIDTNVLKKHSPIKASLLSAALPGAGQFYNKKYWKMPLAVGAIGFSIYKTIDIQKKYKNNTNTFLLKYEYLEWKAKNPNDTSQKDPLPNLGIETLRTQKNIDRRQRDWYILATFGVYALQIVDATVDAHLFYFNIDDNLSLRIAPNPWQAITLSYTINHKNR